MLRKLSVIVKIGVGAVLVIALSAFGVLIYISWRDNAGFAAKYFDGLFPYDAVLASRQWHPLGAADWDCSYAIVSIPQNTPLEPGSRDSTALGWPFAWGGPWEQTPAPPLGDTTRDAIGSCAQRLPDGLAQRLQDALDTDGSLYFRDGVGETIMIFAPNAGLAARIRYGD